MSDAERKPLTDAAESKTLRMRGNSLHGNRETLETPSLKPSGGRFGKAFWPHAGHARFQGVGRFHSTREAGEQCRAIGNGVRGGKGIDQGKRRTNLTRAGRSAGETRHGIVGRTGSSEAG